MFTSGKGLTAEGLYKTDMLTAMAEQKMLNVVGKLAVLVDSSKIGERAGMLFSRAGQIDVVITGKQADAAILKQRGSRRQRNPRLKVLLKKATVVASASGVMRWRTPFCQTQVSPAARSPAGAPVLVERFLPAAPRHRHRHARAAAVAGQGTPADG